MHCFFPNCFIINIIGYVEVMKLLLSHGANVHERTVYGSTAVLAAVDGGTVVVS